LNDWGDGVLYIWVAGSLSVHVFSFSKKSISDSLLTAHLAIEVLKGETVEPGIWYPSEMSQEARTNILEAARENTINYLV